MRELRNLDIAKSIAKKKLVFEEGWMDVLNRLAIYVTISPTVFLPIVSFVNDEFKSPNEVSFLYTLYPASVLLGLYVYYRTFTEKWLVKIDSLHDRKTIRRLLLEYAEENDFDVYRKSPDCVILNETMDSYRGNHKKTRIIMIEDNKVLCTIIRDNNKINLPTFITHFFFRYDIKKLLNKAST